MKRVQPDELVQFLLSQLSTELAEKGYSEIEIEAVEATYQVTTMLLVLFSTVKILPQFEHLTFHSNRFFAAGRTTSILTDAFFQANTALPE